MRSKVYLLFSWVVTFLLSWKLAACPCGCGSISPLYLSPGEKARWQLSVLGEVSPSSKVQRSRYALSAASYLYSSLSSSLYVPVIHNRSSRQNYVGLGDPSLSLRWTLFQGNHTAWSPQVQLASSVKAPIAKSMQDKDLGENKIKAAGNGYVEATPQIDLWFHHGNYSAGLSQGLVHSFDRPERPKVRGKVYLSQASLGYTFWGKGQLVSQWEREEKEADMDRQTKKGGPSKVKYSSGLTGNLKVGDRKTMALSFTTPLEYLSTSGVSKEKKLVLSFIQSV